MKRGLKPFPPGMLRQMRLVETHAPMKRGLKRSITISERAFAASRNTCPDEEGTETNYSLRWCVPACSVETHAPMKRGLKPDCSVANSCISLGRNTCPDEEGTETSAAISRSPSCSASK